jgi:NAD(P)-dependent dehydrogenase (short-subunit alcohol dehydrogenase family)
MSNKQIALITGANKGIGLEVARQLAAKGWIVWLGARDTNRGQKAAGSIQGEVCPLEIDISDDQSVRAAAKRFEASSPRLDALVNNAGILTDADQSLLDVDEETIIETFQTNTLGALRVTRAFLPLLRKSDAPRVINVSSGGGQLSDPSTWAPAYCLSKTALNAVTVQLASTLPGIAVNSACPGWVRTDMGGLAAPRSVEEGASGIVWLAAEASQKITGGFFRDGKPIPW